MRTWIPDKTACLSYYHISENISLTGAICTLEGKETGTDSKPVCNINDNFLSFFLAEK